jgi:hypothetical protein
MMKPLICLIFVSFPLQYVISQVEMPLMNPSFEGVAIRPSINGSSFLLSGWEDWGSGLFPNHSPPDVHAEYSYVWQVLTLPQDGQTYVGLVTRDDGSWECIGQKLRNKLLAGQAYSLILYLCQDSSYSSPTINSQGRLVKFNNPAVVRIWGGDYSSRFTDLLAESDPITHNDWRQYTLDLIPEQDLYFIAISVYFPNNATEPTAGHVLIDNAKLIKYE